MRRIVLMTMFVVWIVGIWAVPPHPLCKKPAPDVEKRIKEMQFKDYSRDELPENVLALRIDFPDRQFDLVADEPDSLSHDRTYFERLMFHLKCYWEDASNENYTFDYYVSENVYTMPENSSFYGNNNYSSERMALLAQQLVEIADDDINFADFDAVIIFHAGPGEETDLEDQNPELIWSTFLTTQDLQEELDEENEDYQGIPADGTFVNAFAVIPETTWQDYFPDGDASYKFGLLGLIAHQFGHHLGLPTLFDNVSSNGISQGIGDFGIMGTGTWAGNGYVPPLPCAWTRVHLGWEKPITIFNDDENLTIDHPLSDGENVIYRIDISETEYFLLENRQLNPDGSMSGGQPSFTFTLLDSTEQDVYPEGHSLAGEPKFNFMENTYKGCEWDFFLPNYDYSTGQTVDGSGLLIWHIDEAIIEANYTPDLELNTINNNATHKGIDLEEADVIQHLDIGVVQPYFRGSPYDAFKAGNNVYFGKSINPQTGMIATPNAESYYGGASVEIFNISESAKQMSFSVRFEWSLSGNYSGECIYPAAISHLEDDNTEIVYPMPDGKVFTWKEFGDESQSQTYFINQEISQLYAYNQNLKKFYFPLKINDDYSGLVTFTDTTMIEPILFPQNYHLTTHPVVIEQFDETVFTLSDSTNSMIRIVDENDEEVSTYEYNDLSFVSNGFWDGDELGFVAQKADSLNYLVSFDYDDWQKEELEFSMKFINPYIYKINICSEDDSRLENHQFLVIDENKIYLFDKNLDEIAGFPVVLNSSVLSQPTFADVDGNGFVDIIVSSENRFFVIGYNGDILNSPVTDIASPDSLGIASGILPFDVDDDNRFELLGNMARNRLYAWQNDFEIKTGFPVSSTARSRTLPNLVVKSDTLYAYIASDNCSISRFILDNNFNQDLPEYQKEFIDLARTAYLAPQTLQNNFESNKIFVDDEVYIYPNPHTNIFGNGFVNFNIMVSRNIDVEVGVYDISGRKIYEAEKFCYQYLNNRGRFKVAVNKLESGVYFAIIKAGNETKKIKFAIEK